MGRISAHEGQKTGQGCPGSHCVPGLAPQGQDLASSLLLRGLEEELHCALVQQGFGKQPDPRKESDGGVENISSYLCSKWCFSPSSKPVWPYEFLNPMFRPIMGSPSWALSLQGGMQCNGGLRSRALRSVKCEVESQEIGRAHV